MKPVRITTLSIASICILLASCTSPSTTGFASARQQTLNVSVSIKGAVRAASVPVVVITTGPMTYDGTRGDVAKNKATSGSTIDDTDTVTLPLPQSNGTAIASSLYAEIKSLAAKDPDQTVPAAFGNMSLEKWKELKASYVKCPECLALTPAEEAALKKTVGKE